VGLDPLDLVGGQASMQLVKAPATGRGEAYVSTVVSAAYDDALRAAAADYSGSLMWGAH
jgi:hypothetical protein